MIYLGETIDFFLLELISICMLINFVGALYILFVMEEVKPHVGKDTDVNFPETELTDMIPGKKSQTEPNEAIESATNTNGNKCTNAIKDFAMVIGRKRNGNARKIVYLILTIVGLSQALEYGMIHCPFSNVFNK